MTLWKKALWVLTFFLFCNLIIPSARGEYAFNDPEVPRISGDAASLILRSLSVWFEALEKLEQKNISVAMSQKQEMAIFLERALSRYHVIKMRSSKRPIDKRKIQIDQLDRMKKDFERFGLAFPKSKKQLGDIAINQINVLLKLIQPLRFSKDPSKNREQIRLVNDEICKLLILGLDASEIAASVK
ncbi:MAG: hypothetical protein DRN92_08145 [Thermoproteota archaeon]|nr:MAG: hypothetical protein DRN92_08145 [Candidatus Korarchaeota archaeon]